MNFSIKNKISNLAYIPLDLPKINIPYKMLRDLFKDQGLLHYPYSSLWNAITLTGSIKNFHDPLECDKAWNNRYKPQKKSIQINPYIPPEISEALLEQIELFPYKVCSFSQILSQRKDIPPHKDGLYENKNCVRSSRKEKPSNFGDQPEPAGLKIMLSHTSRKCFYVCKSLTSNRIFVKFPNGSNTFSCNERTFFHGSKKPKRPKFVLSTFGLIDKNKHQKLIERSVRKYYEQAIWF